MTSTGSKFQPCVYEELVHYPWHILLCCLSQTVRLSLLVNLNSSGDVVSRTQQGPSRMGQSLEESSTTFTSYHRITSVSECTALWINCRTNFSYLSRMSKVTGICCTLQALSSFVLKGTMEAVQRGMPKGQESTSSTSACVMIGDRSPSVWFRCVLVLLLCNFRTV